MAQVFWRLFLMAAFGVGAGSALAWLFGYGMVLRFHGLPELAFVEFGLFVLIMTVAAGFMAILRQNESENK
jgi:hypothetical protein